jgi:hypothetical protein
MRSHRCSTPCLALSSFRCVMADSATVMTRSVTSPPPVAVALSVVCVVCLFVCLFQFVPEGL